LYRKELKRSTDELLDTMREDKREIKDKIDHEYTGNDSCTAQAPKLGEKIRLTNNVLKSLRRLLISIAMYVVFIGARRSQCACCSPL